MSVCRYVCLPVCLSAGMSVCRYVCLAVCLSAGMSVCRYVCLPVCLSAGMSVCRYVPVCLSAGMSVCRYVCLTSSLCFRKEWSNAFPQGIIICTIPFNKDRNLYGYTVIIYQQRWLERNVQFT